MADKWCTRCGDYPKARASSWCRMCQREYAKEVRDRGDYKAPRRISEPRTKRYRGAMQKGAHILKTNFIW